MSLNQASQDPTRGWSAPGPGKLKRIVFVEDIDRRLNTCREREMGKATSIGKIC